MEKFLLVNALASIFIIALIFVFLFREGLPTFYEIPLDNFFLGTTWQAQATPPKFGVLPLLTGSLLVVAGAILISVPIGIGCAIYLAEIARPNEREILKPFIELLAGIPSVVYGFLALTIIATWIQDAFNTTFRLNALNGAIVLSVMILPTIVTVAEDAITSIPREYKEASMALGATRWETIRHIVIPASASGILAGVMLGIGRAVGETMAVLMATGNAPFITFDIFDPVETMTATIAIEMGEVVFGSTHYHALFAIGLVLFTITFIINLIADRATHRYKRMGR